MKNACFLIVMLLCCAPLAAQVATRQAMVNTVAAELHTANGAIIADGHHVGTEQMAFLSEILDSAIGIASQRGMIIQLSLEMTPAMEKPFGLFMSGEMDYQTFERGFDPGRESLAQVAKKIKNARGQILMHDRIEDQYMANDDINRLKARGLHVQDSAAFWKAQNGLIIHQQQSFTERNIASATYLADKGMFRGKNVLRIVMCGLAHADTAMVGQNTLQTLLGLRTYACIPQDVFRYPAIPQGVQAYYFEWKSKSHSEYYEEWKTAAETTNDAVRIMQACLQLMKPVYEYQLHQPEITQPLNNCNILKQQIAKYFGTMPIDLTSAIADAKMLQSIIEKTASWEQIPALAKAHAATLVAQKQ